VELQDAITGLVNNKLLPNTHDGAEGYNSKFNDHMDTIENVGIVLPESLVKCLYLANIQDDLYETIKDQTVLDNLSMMEVQSLMLKKYTSSVTVKGRVYRQNVLQSDQEENEILLTFTQLKTTHGRNSPNVPVGRTSPNTSLSNSDTDPYLIDKNEWSNLSQATKEKINAMRKRIKELQGHGSIRLQTSEPTISPPDIEDITNLTEQMGPFQDTIRQFMLRAQGHQFVLKSIPDQHPHILSTHHALR